MPAMSTPGDWQPAAAIHRPRKRRPARLVQRFLRDRSGTVGMTFALLVIPLTAFVGLAVDFGRVYSVNSHTQYALDAAALAAGRAAQVESSDTINKASAAATAYFDQAKPANVVSSAIEFSPNSQNTEFTVTATSWVRTPFLGVLNALFHQGSNAGAPAGCQGNYYGCVKLVTTSTAELKVGGNGGSNIEVALMLDVTGSMCSPCSKIDDLKSAAKDLVDIVVWDDQSEATARVALAPFAEAVNVGTSLAPLVRGTVTDNSSSHPQVFSNSDMNKTSKQPTSEWIEFPRATGRGTRTWVISSKCVTERIGNEKYTDAPPTTAFVGKGYFGTSSSSSCSVANHSDSEVNLIMPLSSDTTALKARIDKLETGGSTAGHLGTAWAWYLLSPKWNYLFPSSSAAGAYSDLAETTDDGYPKLKKIAVLMTDGEYNINYCKGVEANNSDQSPDIDCNSENGKSASQATSLCTAMKSAVDGGEIEVFAVGFQVSSSARSLLKNCATDENHYYDATTGDALKAAFRDIALKISTLRLTN
jgi:Flp pilus assembly protein TadG